jgi:hypothetical protein
MNYLHQLIAFLNDAEALGLDKQASPDDQNQQQELFT